MRTILTSTTPYVNAPIKKHIGVINTNEVFGVNAFSELVAAFSDGWGGRSGAFRTQMDNIYAMVVNNLKEKALRLGANAIVGLNVNISEITGKGKQMFMASATGTAIVVELENGTSELESSKDSMEVLIDEDSIQAEIDCAEALAKLQFTTSEGKWKTIMRSPNKRTAEYILDRYVHLSAESRSEILADEFKVKITEYVKLLEYNVAVELMYCWLIKEKDMASTAVEIIKSANLFSPKFVLSMIKEQAVPTKTIIELLKCSKQTYSYEDIELMKQIVACFDLSLKGRIEERKGMFGTKRIYICPDGHESSASDNLEECSCGECGKGAYGYSTKEYEVLKAFSKKVEVADMLFGNS